MNEYFLASDALGAVRDTQSRFAQRVQPPWWYHPALGLLIAMDCAALGFPEHLLSRSNRLSLFLLVCIGGFLVARAYRRRTGVAMHSSVGPRTKGLMIGFAACMVLAFASSAANCLWHGPWWTAALVGVVAIVATTLFGQHYTNVLRDELRTRHNL